MSRVLVPFVVLAVLLSATPVLADDTGTVDATVTVDGTCITVGPALDYGTLRFSTSSGTSVGEQSSTYTNCSTLAAQVLANGTDAVSTTTTTTWTLDYPNWFTGTTLNTYAVRPHDVSNFLILTKNPAVYDLSLAAGETVNFTASLGMPFTGSDGAGETMSFAIVFTATN